MGKARFPPKKFYNIDYDSQLFQVMDQLDKKKKVVMEQQSKGEKLAQVPKAPKFLMSYIDRLKALWVDANKQAGSFLKRSILGLFFFIFVFKTNSW